MIVQHFDAFLTYCYTKQFNDRNDAHVATMVYLADYLQMEYIGTKCKQQLKNWKKSKSMRQLRCCDVFEYYECYEQTRNQFLGEFVIDWLCDTSKYMHLWHREKFNLGVSPKFFLTVLEHDKSKTSNVHWEPDLFDYCYSRWEDIDASMFFQLTSPARWPSFLKMMSAITFLEALGKLDSSTLGVYADAEANLKSRCFSTLEIGFLNKTMGANDVYLDRLTKRVPSNYAYEFTGFLSSSLGMELPANIDSTNTATFASIIRDLVLAWKKQDSKNVARVTVEGNLSDGTSGTYERKNGKFVQRRGKWEITSANGKWCLSRQGFLGSVYENNQSSDYAGLPPFEGWEVISLSF